MIDTSRPVRTRDGRRVRIVEVLRETRLVNGDSIIGMVELDSQSDTWDVLTWRADGGYLYGEDSGLDLVNFPGVVTRRAYLYRSDSVFWPSFQGAVASGRDPVASVDVAFEVGKFAGDDK